MRTRQSTQKDDFFADLPIYELFLTITAPLNISSVTSPLTMRLDEYEGYGGSPDSPEWTEMTPGHQLVFKQTWTQLSEFLALNTAWQDEKSVRGAAPSVKSSANSAFAATDQGSESHEDMTPASMRPR